jgi:LCP family protein required for cell wall assembly
VTSDLFSEISGDPSGRPPAASGPTPGGETTSEAPPDGDASSKDRPATGRLDSGDGDGPGPSPDRPKRRRRRRILIVTGLVLAMVVAGGLAVAMERQSAYDANIRRIQQVFPAEAERPAKVVAAAQTWLLIGTDRRPGELGHQRADTIMLAHLPADRERVYIVGLPRDAYVAIPGRGNDKINAAYAYGGPQLLIRSIEKLSGVRIDHFAALDFEGFTSMTKALGGVDVYVAREVHDPMNKVTWPQGEVHLEGERALTFVRQRYNLPGGDFDRIKRQQAVLRAMGQKLAGAEMLTSPLKLNEFLEAATKALSVDEGVTLGTLRDLVFGLRHLRSDDLTALTVPNLGSATVKGASVVKLDRKAAAELFTALKKDKLAEYVEANGGVNDVDMVR